MKAKLQAVTNPAVRYVALTLAGLLLAAVVAAAWMMTDDLSGALEHASDYGALPSPTPLQSL